MHPEFIPGISFLHTYGLMIALGFLIGMQLAAREAARVDIGDSGGFNAFVQDLTFWILIAAMIGARTLFIIAEWDDSYAQNPWKIFKIWEGGLVFYGGLIGALVFSVYYSHRKGYGFLRVADTLIPSVALGQFFGRIGCTAAGCCWGDPVSGDFPLGVQFPRGSLIYASEVSHGIIPATAGYTIHVHPVQLYESFGALIIFFLLLTLRTQKRFNGMVLVGYMWLYAALRFTLEFFRGDAGRGEDVLGTPFSTSQLIAIGMVLTGAAILATQLMRKKAAQPAVAAA